MVSMQQTLALVFGECLVDWIDGVPIPGGAPFNVARHLAAFGVPVQILTRLGQDAHGDLLLSELRRFGVGTSLLQTDQRFPSGQVMVHQDANGHRFDILSNQAYDHIQWDPQALAEACSSATQTPWLVYGTLAQRSAVNRLTLAALRQAVPHHTYCDLNWREGHVSPDVAVQMLQQADILKLSADELVLLLDWLEIDSTDALLPPVQGTTRAEVAQLLKGSTVTRLLITYGAEGYAQFGATGQCVCRGHAQPLTQLADTVGAGDAFSSVALMGAMLGWSDELSLARANDFAAAICQVPGAAPQNLSFYDPWKQRWFGSDSDRI